MPAESQVALGPTPGKKRSLSGATTSRSSFRRRTFEILDAGRTYANGKPPDTIRDGDVHSSRAGFSAKSLPPAAFEPVGVVFITGSVSALGLVEAYEHRFPKDHPLRALYMSEVGGKKQPMVNLLLHHGVRSSLEYQSSGDAERARRASNPDLAPHVSFLDMGGHGYATLHLTANAIECEFVCIPRPLERSPGADGGPLRYRIVHHVPMWRPGERPRLKRRILEGDPGLAL